MFGMLFKDNSQSKKQNFANAEALYASALGQTRQEVFFKSYGVPDTFDGRFDLLLVHLFLILNRILKSENQEDLAQALFDVTFRDMDQTLREMGIGDMGVPKHMRKMMKAFNGRMHAYQMALDPESLRTVHLETLKESTMSDALLRNLYATAKDITPEQIEAMESYVRKNIKDMRIEDQGRVTFVQVN